MAKFMALQSFVYGGALYEASPLNPRIFDFPDDELPSKTWRPLDGKAEVSLKRLAEDVKERTAVKTAGSDSISVPGVDLRIHKIPKEMEGQVKQIEQIERVRAPDPDALPGPTVAAAVVPPKDLITAGLTPTAAAGAETRDSVGHSRMDNVQNSQPVMERVQEGENTDAAKPGDPSTPSPEKPQVGATSTYAPTSPGEASKPTGSSHGGTSGGKKGGRPSDREP